MALQKSFNISGVALISCGSFNYQDDEFSSSISDVYVKIDSVDANKHQGTFIVGFYKDGKRVGAKTFLTNLNLSGDNFIKQGYLHLKTLSHLH